MIKAVIEKDDGTKTVLLGLSRLNTIRLHLGKPIEVKLSELGLDTDLTIALVAGETEEAIAAEIQAAFQAKHQEAEEQ